MSSRSTDRRVAVLACATLAGCFDDPELAVRIARPTADHNVLLRACEVAPANGQPRCEPDDLQRPNANAFGLEPSALVEETLIYVAERHAAVDLDIAIGGSGDVLLCVRVPIAHGSTTRRRLDIVDVVDPMNPAELLTTATWTCPERPEGCEAPAPGACPE